MILQVPLPIEFIFSRTKTKRISIILFLLFINGIAFSQTPVDTIPATEKVSSDSVSTIKEEEVVVQDSPEEGTLVEGYVRDENTGLPVPDALVVIKGSADGGTTDSTGKFSFSTPQKFPLTLSVSYDGNTQEIVVPSSPEQPIEVKYKPAVVQDKVVIVGYGSRKNKELVGSVAQINPEEVQQIPVASFDAQLQGKASGVQINSQNGIPGDAVIVRVRGASSINASADPLYIVDGVFVNNQSLSRVDLGGKATSPMADINPSDIESIEVLKDASSTAIYGSRGANGVIIVTTKRGKFEQKPRVTFNSLQGFAWANKNRLWDLS